MMAQLGPDANGRSFQRIFSGSGGVNTVTGTPSLRTWPGRSLRSHSERRAGSEEGARADQREGGYGAVRAGRAGAHRSSLRPGADVGGSFV